MKVYIKILNKSQIFVDVEESNTIEDLKKKV